MRLNEKAIEQDVQRWVSNPGPPPEQASFSAWSATKALGTSPARGSLELGASIADLSTMIGGEDWWLTQQGKNNEFDTPKFSSAPGNFMRRNADEYAPDPLTASTADQAISALGSGMFKAVGSVVALGPYAGGAIFGVEEANNSYQRLIEKGVDPAAAAKVAGITGAASAIGVMAPAGGATWLKTLGIAAGTGPATYVAQEALSKEILQRAGYQHEADTHDPTDALGLILSIGIPGAVGALHMRGVTRAARLDEITKHIESGGNRYGKDGQLLTSSRGAKGEMQVLDSTMLDPGFGVKPADTSGTPEQQADERARVGRDYRSAMVERYQGDMDKAFAAYNAGPGAVDKAIKAHGDEWLSHLPDETKAYVGKARRLLREGGLSEAAADPAIVDAARVKVLDATVARSLPERPGAYGEVMRATDDVAAGNVHEAAPAVTRDEARVQAISELRSELDTIVREAPAEGLVPAEASQRRALEAQLAELPGTAYAREQAAITRGETPDQARVTATREIQSERSDMERALSRTGDVASARMTAAKVQEEIAQLEAGGIPARHADRIARRAEQLVTQAPRPPSPSMAEIDAAMRGAAEFRQPPRAQQVQNALPDARAVAIEQPAATTAAAPEGLPVDTKAVERVVLEQPGLKVKLPGSDETIGVKAAMERIEAQRADEAQEADWVKVALECALSGGQAPAGPESP